MPELLVVVVLGGMGGGVWGRTNALVETGAYLVRSETGVTSLLNLPPHLLLLLLLLACFPRFRAGYMLMCIQ
jgi:hypothetical protein